MKNDGKWPDDGLAKRRRYFEWGATFGLLLICVSLIVPFFNPDDISFISGFKWVYSAGALVYFAARVMTVNVKGESVRLRRLRRMEAWAGIAFIIGASFWFYSEAHLGNYAGMLAILRQTILFTLVGAVIQIIASWMIVAQQSKEKGLES